MKSIFRILIITISILAMVGCTRIPPGHVGVKVYLNGGDKGVDSEVLGVGYEPLLPWQEIYKYPTYQINYTFTEAETEESPTNEEFVLQSKEGMVCEMDLGVAIRFDKSKISNMFQNYRKGPEEIRSIVVRNSIRDALNKVASRMDVESIYSHGKSAMIDSVTYLVKSQLDTNGIIVDKISLIGAIRLPDNVKMALDNKVAATQRAQQRENELREAEAQAKKLIAQAEGEAQANRLKMSSLTREIIEWQKLQNQSDAIQKWNGQLPKVTGGATPLIDVTNL